MEGLARSLRILRQALQTIAIKGFDRLDQSPR